MGKKNAKESTAGAFAACKRILVFHLNVPPELLEASAFLLEASETSRML